MKFRRGILIMLAMLLMLSASAIAQDKSSVLRQKNQFAVQCNDFSKTETHAMELKAGDTLDINSVITGGTIHVVVKRATGEVIHESEGIWTDSIEIDADGIYRFVVTGDKATGSVRIGPRAVAAPNETADVPYRLERMQGRLGYEIEYNPDLFGYAEGDGVDMFYLLSSGDAALPEAMVTIMRQPGTLDAIAFDSATELPPSTIDWRAARSARFAATEGAEVLCDQTYIEMDGETLFAVLAQYTAEQEPELSEAVRNMVASLRFLD